MKPGRARLLAVLFLAAPAAGAPTDPLADGFLRPPPEARPKTWWHWMNDSVTKEGITADLEAMAAAGIGGAQVFNAALANADTRTFISHPAAYLSPEWFDLERHALTEAGRLGLDLSFDTGPGVTESGASWVTPDRAMQHLVWSETRIDGQTRGPTALPVPPVHYGLLQGTPPPGPFGHWVGAEPAGLERWYRDVAVVAFPTPDAEDNPAPAPLRATASAPGVDAAALWEPGPAHESVFPPPSPANPAWIAYDFGQPVILRSAVVLGAGSGAYGDASVECGDDGASWREIAALARYSANLWDRFAPCTTAFPGTRAKFFRIVFRSARGTADGTLRLRGARLSPAARIDHWEAKAAFVPAVIDPVEPGPVPGNEAIDPARVLDLSGRLRPDGSLDWKAPPGHWTVLRIGHAPMGILNGGAMAEGTGLEVDKLDREAVEAYLAGGTARIIAAAGPAAGRELRGLLMDSWEAFAENWTHRFPAEFARRRGYDPRPWLPVMTGRVVGNPRLSGRFLFDVRRTLAELLAENHYGTIEGMARRSGLKLYAEAPGHWTPTVADCFATKDRVDVPMGEFWLGNSFDWVDAKQAVAAAQLYGKRIVATESFTSVPEFSGWRESPATMKVLGDRYFALGVNLFILHTSVHQPWLDRTPGMTLGPYGSHFERTNGWLAVAGRPWTDYLARCQFLLQRGLPVVDACYFAGEDVPNDLPIPGDGRHPALPAGHDFGACSGDALLHGMRVVGGRLVARGGMSYAVLVLPDDATMTLAAARRLRALVAAGATVAGPRPRRSPSLSDGPGADRELGRIADEVWGPPDGSPAGGHRFGLGRVAWGMPLRELLPPPDFDYDRSTSARLAFSHRRDGDDEIYFVSNQGPDAADVTASFRVAGRRPEAWDAEDGSITSVPRYAESGGRTRLPLRLEANGSIFIVFRRAATPGVAPGWTAGAGPAVVLPVAGPWSLAFPGLPDGSGTGPLRSWTDDPREPVRHFSGTASYTARFEIPAGLLAGRRRVALDLGLVGTFAAPSLNGHRLRLLWHRPYEVDVTAWVRPGMNRLEVSVTNLLVNRLIGEEAKPASLRATWRLPGPGLKDAPLQPSGLLGPVRLIVTPAAGPGEGGT